MFSFRPCRKNTCGVISRFCVVNRQIVDSSTYEGVGGRIV